MLLGFLQIKGGGGVGKMLTKSLWVWKMGLILNCSSFVKENISTGFYFLKEDFYRKTQNKN